MQEDGAGDTNDVVPLHDEEPTQPGDDKIGTGVRRRTSEGDRADTGDHMLLRKSEKRNWTADLPGDGPPISKYETADEGASSSDEPRGAHQLPITPGVGTLLDQGFERWKVAVAVPARSHVEGCLKGGWRDQGSAVPQQVVTWLTCCCLPRWTTRLPCISMCAVLGTYHVHHQAIGSARFMARTLPCSWGPSTTLVCCAECCLAWVRGRAQPPQAAPKHHHHHQHG